LYKHIDNLDISKKEDWEINCNCVAEEKIWNWNDWKRINL